MQSPSGGEREASGIVFLSPSPPRHLNISVPTGTSREKIQPEINLDNTRCVGEGRAGRGRIGVVVVVIVVGIGWVGGGSQ